MAISAWPFESSDTTEVQFSKLMQVFQDTGVLSGFNLTAGSGMQVSVAAGAASVQGFYVESTAATLLTIAAASTTYARADYVVLKLDLDANAITLTVKTGTASATPVPPTLTQTTTVWEHPIGIVNVPKSASNIVASNLVERLAGTGMRVIPYRPGERPANPGRRTLGIDLTTGVLELFDGTSWSNVTPPSHTHTTTQISDATTIGKALMKASTLAAAQQAVGLYTDPTDPGVKPAGSVWVRKA